MREKRYSKDMKGTQGKEKERYPLLEVFPLKRKAIREINEREGGIEEDGAITEYANTLELFLIGRKEREGKGDNKGSFCRSGARIGGNGKRKLYNGF